MSLVVSWHWPSSQNVSLPQSCPQLPPAQIPPAQTWPQYAQFCASESPSVHVPPQQSGFTALVAVQSCPPALAQ